MPLARRLRSLADTVLRWPLLVAWLALIFALSSIPNEVQSPSSLPFDKVAHLVEYGALAFIAAWVFGRGHVTSRIAAIAVAFALLYGVSDELHQAFVPGRDPSLDDLAADGVGALLGALVAWMLSRARD
ncbi:MAG TPA: VanZ family protein [Dehalococcoidia bacterium]|jgi:VanZ family protein